MTVTEDAPPGAELAAIGPMLAAAWQLREVELLETRRLSAGASRLSWSLDVRAGDRIRPLVVQRERVRGQGRSDVGAEARVMRAAGKRGVPVPEVIAVDPVGDGLGGAFMVTARIEGETIPRRILRSTELAAARHGFAGQCGRILAAIHSIPVGEVEPLAEPDPIHDIEKMLDASGDPRPALEIGMCWLRATRPAPTRRAVVHGDFRNGNLIVGSDGVRAVLDWELAHLGDPVEDLGWLCARAWRWGARPVVGGMGSVSDLLAGYASARGEPVDADVFFWWQLLATVKWGVMCLEQARTHLSGEARSVELAVLGRLAAEVEYDVLRLVERGE